MLEQRTDPRSGYGYSQSPTCERSLAECFARVSERASIFSVLSGSDLCIVFYGLVRSVIRPFVHLAA